MRVRKCVIPMIEPARQGLATTRGFRQEYDSISLDAPACKMLSLFAEEYSSDHRRVGVLVEEAV